MNLKHKLMSLISVSTGIIVFAVSINAVQPDPGSIDSLVMGNTEFAVKLYKKLKHREGNLFFSPYSISTALAMTYAGARVNTAKQMKKTLCFKLDQQQLHPTFRLIEMKLNGITEQGDVILNLANSLWPQDKYPFLKTYLNLVQENYSSVITPVNYKKDTEKVRLQINEWVENKTMEKIKNLIQPGYLDPLSRLVLVNAIYFKGKWLFQFDKENTQDAPFWSTPEKCDTVPMMHQKAKFGYDERDSLQILELRYKGEDISMFIILPMEKHGLDQVQKNLTAQNLTEWTKYTSTKEVVIFLPRFSMTSSFDLTKTLQAMGMKDAFAKGKSDFSGMDGKKKWLYIDAVVHKAFVDVNEEGTEAAAATAVMMRTLAIPVPPPVVRADHPFLFVIRENSKGNILFVGRMVNPAIKSQ